MYFCYHSSPLGTLRLAGTEQDLHQLFFPNAFAVGEAPDNWTYKEQPFAEVRAQLDAYFNGKRQRFELHLAPSGTPFQRDVLAALQQIPYGETRAYSDIAHSVGRPKAVRAVGAANGRNPIAIIIPCHRVIGRDGSLTGFGGGLKAKQLLLNLEANHS
ncbi:MAG: methylated-DNA--[protein]-cysteine S-methyltransferase [Halieaceae bacterium]|nr:methylated-DNA--[protein]-cysteine S-methyltransferase [Halieaceae bacterium]